MYSLVTSASISAQDTTPGHLLSTIPLALSMISYASAGISLLSCASFSASSLLPGLLDNKTDPSHPYQQDTPPAHHSNTQLATLTCTDALLVCAYLLAERTYNYKRNGNEFIPEQSNRGRRGGWWPEQWPENL